MNEAEKEISGNESIGDVDSGTINGFIELMSELFSAQQNKPVEIYKNSQCTNFSIDTSSKKIIYSGKELVIKAGETIEIIPPIYCKNDIGILYIAKSPLVTNLSYITSRKDTLYLHNISDVPMIIKPGDSFLTFFLVPLYLDFSEENLNNINSEENISNDVIN